MKAPRDKRLIGGKELAEEIGIHKDMVYHRVRVGLSFDEIRALGAIPLGLLKKQEIRLASKAAGVNPVVLLYRVSVLGWSLARAEMHGNNPHPPVPAVIPRHPWDREAPPPSDRSHVVRQMIAGKAGGTRFRL